MLPFTFKSNLSTETFYDFFGNDKSKTNASSIDWVSWLHKPKQLKQFTLVFSFDAHSVIFDLDFAIAYTILIVYRVKNIYFSTLFREF